MIQAVTEGKVNPQLQKLKEVAQSFESVFMQMMMKSMRSAVKKSGFMDGGQAESTFTGLLDEQIAERSGSGLGIAKMILKQYSKYLKPESKIDEKA